MPEWQDVLLGDVILNFDSRRVPVRGADRQPGPYPYYGASGIVDSVAEYLFDGEYLLIAEDGENLRTRKTPVAFMATGKFWVNNHAHVVRGNERANTRFLCHALEASEISGFLTGSTQPKLSQSALNRIRLRLPDRHTQDAIAAVLGALDGKIAINERIAMKSERLLNAHFESLGIMNDRGDSRVPLTELVDFNPRLPKPPEDEPVYVDMAALSTNRATIASWTHREPKSGTRFANGDTLVARITPCLENGKTGYVDFMPSNAIGIGSTEFIVMRSKVGNPPELSYFIARSERFREHAIRGMVGSSGRQRVSAADAANIEVYLPDQEALESFGVLAASVFEQIKALATESRALTTLRDTLLPKLMSGQLTVRQAETLVEQET